MSVFLRLIQLVHLIEAFHAGGQIGKEDLETVLGIVTNVLHGRATSDDFAKLQDVASQIAHDLQLGLKALDLST